MRSHYRKKPVKERVPEWLKTIQLNSWEAELLISALLLYALFTVPDIVVEYSRRELTETNMLFKMISRLMDAITILKVGYILHILIRGLWISNVGLSYVFPKGIDRRRLKFKGKFDSELDRNELLESSIIRIEKIASAIYGISFMIFGVFIGVFISLFILIIVFQNMMQAGIYQENAALTIIGFCLSFIYILAALFVLLDFVTNGYFRKIDWLVKVYYPISYFFRIITFSFIYRKPVLTLITNLPKWQSRSIPFLIVIVFLAFTEGKSFFTDFRKDNYYIENESFQSIMNYEDRRQRGNLMIVTIPSDIIQGNVMRIFLRELPVFEMLYRSEKGRRFNERWETLSREEKIKVINEYLILKVDEKEINPQWLASQHFSEFYQGYYSYLDLEDFERGQYICQISIDKNKLNEIHLSKIDTTRLQLANIPFYYAGQ